MWMKRGACEMVGFMISTAIILPIIFIMMGSITFYSSLRMVDIASQAAARKAVVCEDMSSAERAAASRASEILGPLPQIGAVNTRVEYAPGSKHKWEKGSFIYVTVAAHVHSSVPALSGTKRGITMSMVERKKKDEGLP